jgi:hypothetical protein
MKTIYIILIFAAAFVALYEQSLAKPNIIIMAIAIVVFMLGMMKLMTKVPGKGERNNDDHEI